MQRAEAQVRAGRTKLVSIWRWERRGSKNKHLDHPEMILTLYPNSTFSSVWTKALFVPPLPSVRIPREISLRVLDSRIRSQCLASPPACPSCSPSQTDAPLFFSGARTKNALLPWPSPSSYPQRYPQKLDVCKNLSCKSCSSRVGRCHLWSLAGSLAPARPRVKLWRWLSPCGLLKAGFRGRSEDNDKSRMWVRRGEVRAAEWGWEKRLMVG